MTVDFVPNMSYSSACLINSCERKYWLTKVAKVPIDTDCKEDSEPFLYGNVYHTILENVKHRRVPDLREQVIKFARARDMTREQIFKVYAMVSRYLTAREDTGLQEKVGELRFQTKDYIGFIDSIITDAAGVNWWILDLKTSTQIGKALGARVHRDLQLNFYASFVPMLCQDLKLEEKNFRGVRYSICTRPQAKPKKTETMKEFALRAKVNYDEYVVDAKDLRTDIASKFLETARKKQLELFELKDIEQTTPNFTSCESYFKPCSYWSRCYGKNVTDVEPFAKSIFPKPIPEIRPEEDDF